MTEVGWRGMKKLSEGKAKSVYAKGILWMPKQGHVRKTLYALLLLVP